MFTAVMMILNTIHYVLLIPYFMSATAQLLKAIELLVPESKVILDYCNCIGSEPVQLDYFSLLVE